MESEFAPAQNEIPLEYNISVQFGDHDAGLINDSFMGTINEIRRGRLDIHAWSQATQNRIKLQQPNCLTIDSTHVNDIDEAVPESLWYLLPGRPSELNSSSSIELIAGDIRLSRLVNINNPEFNIIENEEILDQITGQRNARLGDGMIGLALGIAISLSSIRSTRREFLHKAGMMTSALASGLAFGKLTLPTLHSQVNNPQIYEKVLKASELLRPYMTDGFQWAADGRTAIAISKTLDYGDSNTIILFGSGHAESRVSDMINNRDTRLFYINKYVENFTGMVKDYENKFPSLIGQELKEKFRLALPVYDVLSIQDPLIVPHYQELRQCIQRKEKRVCKEIQDAL